MKKIMIIGCGGAGKSTLAKRLGEKLNLHVYHLDSMFWKPEWVPTEREEWKRLQFEILEKDEWIIDGNYGSTLDIRIEKADTIIFLDYSTVTCLYGVIKRRIIHHRKTRPDMGEGCPEKLDWEFLKWVAEYKRKKSPIIVNKLNQLEQQKSIIHLRTRRETEDFVKTL